MNRIFKFTDSVIDKLIKSEKLNALLKKIISREMFDYIFFGVLATVVSLISFSAAKNLLLKLMSSSNSAVLIANIISWIITVTFAFFTNKFFVFHSKSMKGNTLIKEIISFTGARLFSLGVEEAGLLIAQVCFNASEHQFMLFSKTIDGAMIAKVILQFVVVVMNYVFSKLFIFKNKEKTDK